MYEYLEGKVAEATPSYLVIDCGGVGYRIEITLSTYTAVKELEHCKVLIYQIIREDAHLLFGFFSSEERELFTKLLSVSGIGANTARMMLSALNIRELCSAIISKDTNTIQRIKGIGKKTAERIVLELSEILQKTDIPLSPAKGISHRYKNEALMALQTLGFNKFIAEKAVDKILAANVEMSCEDIIKQALKML
ncbi:MAG: Holliday junction branch migration protein RuvA [Bacteroidales bacterium]|jgi:Holliday junction DNA helicase RuvA|nr:Holliday junction branch migration protein RuvA [Bacteroidales bacterium]